MPAAYTPPSAVTADSETGRVITRLPVTLFWIIINILLFVGMTAHQIENTSSSARSSTFYLLAIGLAVIPAIAGLVVTFSDQTRFRLARLPVTAGKFQPALLIALCLGIIGLWLPSGEALLPRLSITFNLVYLCILLVSVPPSQDKLTVRSLRADWLLPVLFIALVALAFFSIARFPVEHSGPDEIWFTNYAVTWLETGSIYGQFLGAPPIPITVGTGYWLIPYALWMDAFGVSLSAARGFMFIVYVAASLLTGWAASRHYGRTIGWLAAVIFAASPFVMEHRWLRPELIMTIPVALVIGLLAERKRVVGGSFAIGLIAAFSLDIHGSGIVLIISTCAVFGVRLLGDLIVRRQLRLTTYLAFALGGLTGGAVFFVSHILVLDDPAAFFNTVSGTRRFLQGLSPENLSNFWRYVTEVSIIDLLLFGLVAVALIATRLRRDWILITLLLAGVASYVIVVPNGQRYIAGWMPVLVTSLAGLIGIGLEKGVTLPAPASAFWRMIAVVALSGFCISQSIRNASLSDAFPAANMPERTSMIRDIIADPNALIAGDLNDYWFMLDTLDFYATVSDFEIMHHITPQPPYSVWANIQPQVVYHTNYANNPILGPYISAYLRDNAFVLVEEFTLDGLLTRIWMHSEYLADRRANGTN